MEGVEGLYKKFGVLADAKEKAGEFEDEYLSILDTIRNGSDPEKRLCASFIPRFFKSFPKYQETAFNAQIDLCQEEEAVIRREAIKGLPDLCKADNSLVPRLADILAQLLPIDGHLDQTIVKHCLVQLLKQDTEGAIAGIINQVICGREVVRETVLKFLSDRFNEPGKFITNGNDKVLNTIFSKLGEVLESVTFEEFQQVVQLGAKLDKRRAHKLISGVMDLDAPFDPSNLDLIEKVTSCVPYYIKYLPKDMSGSTILKYFSTALSLFPQISSLQHQIMCLEALAECLTVNVSVEDAALCIDGIYTLVVNTLPQDPIPDVDSEVTEPPHFNISALECLLYCLHRTAKLVPEFLKEENRLGALEPKLNYVLRCCSCYAKRLKGSSISEDGPEKVKLKTRAYKSCNNTKELVKGLVSSPVTFKTDVSFSWKVDYTNVTNRLFSPRHEKRSHPTARPSPPKRRRSGGQSIQQVYMPPTGRYSGVTNGRSEERRRY